MTEKAKEEINVSGESVLTIEGILDGLYSTWVGDERKRSTPLNDLIVDAYAEHTPQDVDAKIEALIDQMKFIPGKIKDRADSKVLFRQPAILLVYYLVQRNRRAAKEAWPLTDDELRPVFSDLGHAL